MKYVCSIFFSLSLWLNILAVNNVRDSLENLLSSQSGNQRLQTLLLLSDHLTYDVPVDAVKYATEAMQLAEYLRTDSLKFKALKIRGYANGYAGNLGESMRDMDDGLRYYISLSDSVKMAEAISDIGYLFLNQGVYDKALAHYQRALTIREKIGDAKGIAYSLNNIGTLYWKLGKADESLFYHSKAVDYFEKNNMEEELGIIYANFGEIYLIKGDDEKALQYFERSLRLNHKQTHRVFEANNLNSIGRIWLNRKNTQKAIRIFRNALDIQKDAGDKNGMALTNFNLGIVFRQLNQPENAIRYFEEAIMLAEMAQANEVLINSLSQISEVYGAKGDYKSAFTSLKRGKLLSDSIFNIQKNQQIEELKTRYETERHILENSSLKTANSKNSIIIRQQRSMLTMIAVLSLMVLISIWLLLERRRSLDKLRAVELEQKLLRSQMNPHFIFNTLTAIQRNILQKTVREGVNLISSLASLMRLTLENSSNEFISFAKEIQSLELYLVLQQQRFSDQFRYSIVIDANIDAENILIPPMLVQPFVENAIDHGFAGINYEGVLRISYRLENDLLHCEVEDNGIGYLKCVKMKSPEHHSYGIDITGQRIDILRRKYRLKVCVSIVDISDDVKTGTLVKITMPLKKNSEV
ncbi:MAG: tetratricopeptide repeat protein [Paludibacter sp.]|jgi:tetratricopeptide (TPR) repeat protein|nr:tetratricopeptide repeat protein [Paludibacter sp.]